MKPKSRAWWRSAFLLKIKHFCIGNIKFQGWNVEVWNANRAFPIQRRHKFPWRSSFPRKNRVQKAACKWRNDNFFSGWRNAEIMKCFPFLHKSLSISIARSVIFTRYAIPSFKGCRSECSRKKENKQTTFIKIYLTPPVNSGPAGIIFLGFLCQFRWYDP